MRVAVTGSLGFTGGYVEKALAEAGAGFVALEVDLTDPEAVEAEVARLEFDRLIHLAGEAFVASDDWRRFYAVNQIGTMNLLDAVARHHPGARCLLASSAQVYGPGASGLVDESRPPRPNNHYAFSKLAMEICAQAFAPRLELVVVRPFNYTGSGQEERYIVPKIVAHFRRRAETIELGNIEARRDFGDVRSASAAYAGLVLAEDPPALVNLCSGELHSIRDLIDMAEALTGHSLRVEVNPAFLRAGEVAELGGDPSLLQAALPDWRPHRIRETLAWMLSAE